jgi:CrcB protein
VTRPSVADSGRFAPARRGSSRRPAWSLVGAVFVGGCIGGIARYGVTRLWPTSANGFPWATFVINISGAFVLALLLVLITDWLPPNRYMRPLLGTGFCGAWTTFSSVAVSTDQLVAHNHAVTGILYVIASLGVGLVAAAAGLATGRLIARGPAGRRGRRADGSS